MTRRFPTTNGLHINGDGPPPSTLAAQIVQNQTGPPAAQHNGETPTFAELLHEILHNHAATPETDLNTNVKLVNVVAEAGLAPLASDNPFAQWDVLIPLAVDSISVIEATIERQPGILFAQTKPEEPQLLLSLLVRLLAVCGRAKCETLPIKRLLSSLLHALDSSLELWKHARDVREIIQDCVSEVLSSLETTGRSKTPFSVRLPPARSIARLWPESSNIIALPHGCQTSINDLAHGLMLALELCQIPRLSVSWRAETQHALQEQVLSARLRLESSNQWESMLKAMLESPASTMIASYLVREMSRSVPSSDLQTCLAKALVDALRNNGNAVCDRLLTPLCSLTSSDAFEILHEDLRIAMTTVIARLCKQENQPERVQRLCEALRQDNVMTDSEFQTSFRKLSVDARGAGWPSGKKRRKISQDATIDSHQVRIRRATKQLTSIEADDLNAVPEVTLDVYRSLNEEEQCATWQVLIDLAQVDAKITGTTISKLLEGSALRLSKEARVLCLLAIRACVERTTDGHDLDLAKSVFGQHCLRGLHSSLRELRLAANHCLPAFLRIDLPSELRIANCKVALEYLRALSDRDQASEQETLVIGWSQVARICDDAELNLCLLRLVDYLGHANSLICGLAFTELERIAEAKDLSMADLFKPFWSSIAVSVVQELHTRPQKAQQLCQLLEMDLNQFLVHTQQDSIPILVLTKKKEILQKVAGARGYESTVQDLLLQPRTNLMATLALLLAQTGSDVENDAMSCLVDVAPGLRGTDLASLVKIDPTLLACYMLKYTGDQDPKRKSRAYQAFQLFTSLAERQPGQARLKPSRLMAEFFDMHILGIMTHFSEIIENTTNSYSKLERLRCIRAIAEMIVIAKKQVSGALAQIRAVLQSSMEQDDLCEASFAAWLHLLPVLESDDLARVVDQTFASILRHWETLSTQLRQRCHEEISNLVKNHNQMLQENIMTLPSLHGIPLLAKVSAEIERVKASEGVEVHCKAFTKRLGDESQVVVLRALEELPEFLMKNEDFIHDSATTVQPTPVLSELFRAILDASVKYSAEHKSAAELSGKALGIIGCLDPSRIEVTRKKRRLVVLSNFDRASEVEDWTLVLLEDILVKAFKSVNNARAQGFLAFVMQELLRFCEFNDGTVLRTRATQGQSKQQKWLRLPEHVRITLTPLVNSRYVVTSSAAITAPNRAYPGFSADASHSSWLRLLVYDLMWRAKGDNPKMVFPVLARTIRGHDIAIASFMLPYAMLNVVLGGTVSEFQGISDEFLAILSCEPVNDTQTETVKLCSESVFHALDYMSMWLQEKRKNLGETRANSYKTGHTPTDFDEVTDMAQIDTVERFLATIPADVVANRAILCGSYARALFNWEQHIRRKRPLIPDTNFRDDDMLYDKLLSIYAQIDEPDGLEGISAHLQFISEEQQAMQHVKAGRWAAAQGWYELQLAESHMDLDIQERLLGCFQETGRYEPLIKYGERFLEQRFEHPDPDIVTKRLLPSILEAEVMTSNVTDIIELLTKFSVPGLAGDFNYSVARILETFWNAQGAHLDKVCEQVQELRIAVIRGMTFASTSSVQACHGDLRKLHVLHDIEHLCSLGKDADADLLTRRNERRVSILGSHSLDKQYVLGILRTAIRWGNPCQLEPEGAAWLMAAKLARSVGNTEHAYSAVLKASETGNSDAKIEEAKLLWRDGHQRKAIHALESAIAAEKSGNGVKDPTKVALNESTISTRSTSTAAAHAGDLESAKLHLLLAKWLDASGQIQTGDMLEKFQHAAKLCSRWDKGHYYLGKHYQKLLDAEKVLPSSKQSSQYRSGELARLVVENLIRSIPFGNKYWHETVPKILTLWLELGSNTIYKTRGEEQELFDRRVKALQGCNRQLQKYFERVPPYVFYTAIPQMISRITHQNGDVWKILSSILIRVTAAHPHQSLWSVLPIVKSADRTRVERGMEILNRLKDPKTKAKNTDGSNVDLRVMITNGQRLTDGLLHVCEVPLDKRDGLEVRLSEHLGFSHKLAPSQLVVPIETTLTINLPSGANHETIKKHKAFVQEKITIHSFAEDVLVLNSLQKPRKLTVRGSDGKQYGLLCKPKDDLRKDRRLMEFNGTINRALKSDAESSKRRLYVKTYAVTPLSEESGIIEWVEGIKPMRDILLSIYHRKQIRPNYAELKTILDQACSSPEQVYLFNEKVLSKFPPVLHEWFAEVYPEPDAWFAARLRYARSAAVMSMAGHVLGLGDRHGENILLEESSGGVFHVDFNCLFDKGMTFDKPELVPFRLTHNMVDAMGPYGYEGPFRKSSELTLRLLRQSKDTLMTVLETFLYDPTTDFIGQKKKRATTAKVPETPQEILESVEGKLKGMLKSERVPLGVEGYVDALIKEATSPWCLASMYIGWCAFL